jgi:putative phosphoribosyl transferase
MAPMARNNAPNTDEREVSVPLGDYALQGNLTVPKGARGLVLFAHGSGSSRHSPRNRYVARVLNDTSFATFLIDLLTEAEELADARTGHLRFDIGLLAQRLAAVIDWLAHERSTRDLSVGVFGASTGGGAAIVAAALRQERVGAVVSRGGRPDLAGEALSLVRAPTLLIVGGADYQVLELNRMALARMRGPHQLMVVPGATHLFEEPGALEQVATLAAEWFKRYLAAEGPNHDHAQGTHTAARR